MDRGSFEPHHRARVAALELRNDVLNPLTISRRSPFSAGPMVRIRFPPAKSRVNSATDVEGRRIRWCDDESTNAAVRVSSLRPTRDPALVRLSQSRRSRSTHLFVGAYRGIDRKTTLTCSKVCARPAGARGEHTRLRSAYSRRQPHLSEQAGDARELIRGWRSCEPRHCAGGRAAARTDKRQLIKC